MRHKSRAACRTAFFLPSKRPSVFGCAYAETGGEAEKSRAAGA